MTAQCPAPNQRPAARAGGCGPLQCFLPAVWRLGETQRLRHTASFGEERALSFRELLLRAEPLWGAGGRGLSLDPGEDPKPSFVTALGLRQMLSQRRRGWKVREKRATEGGCGQKPREREKGGSVRGQDIGGTARAEPRGARGQGGRGTAAPRLPAPPEWRVVFRARGRRG